MIKALPILIVIWAALTVLFLALLAYKASIARYEEDQLFLDEASTNVVDQQQQTSILRKVHKLQPVIRGMGALSAIFTVLIIAIYACDCWQKLQAN